MSCLGLWWVKQNLLKKISRNCSRLDLVVVVLLFYFILIIDLIIAYLKDKIQIHCNLFYSKAEKNFVR